MSVSPCNALFLKKGSTARRRRDWRPGTFGLPTLYLEGDGSSGCRGALEMRARRAVRWACKRLATGSESLAGSFCEGGIQVGKTSSRNCAAFSYLQVGLMASGRSRMAIPRGCVPATCTVSTTVFVAVLITDRLLLKTLLV